jgi:hypothetical protein
MRERRHPLVRLPASRNQAAEKTLEFLDRLERDIGYRPGNCRVFITGSGGAPSPRRIGAKFVQEVTAVSLAVEKAPPEVNSVIELGGQDAKIIVFKEDAETGRKKKIPSMNDKCAGGTGAVIDKINAKLKIPVAELCDQGYDGIKLHKVAGKCGVFAETDINGLQKEGHAFRRADGVALRRDHPAEPHRADPRATRCARTCCLLGGPNTFIAACARRGRRTSPECGRNAASNSRARPPQSLHLHAEQRAVLRGARRGDLRRTKRRRSALSRRPRAARYITVGRLERRLRRRAALSSSLERTR